MSETSHPDTAADVLPPRQRLRTKIAVSALMIAGLGNLAFTLSIIPRFAQIFHDVFEHRPLPTVTTLILNHQWVSVALACVWLLAAICTIRSRRAQRYIGAIAVLMGLEAIFITGALVIPLIRMTQQVFGD